MKYVYIHICVHIQVYIHIHIYTAQMTPYTKKYLRYLF